MTILIKNAFLADGTLTDVLVRDGSIAEMGALDVTADKVLDATGKTLLPAFVDMHTHLREPGFEKKEDIATGTAAAVRGGYGTVCCMPNTNPPLDNVPMVKYVTARAKEAGLCNVHPIGCITKGMQSKELADMARMRAAGAIAFSDDGKPVMDNQLMRYAMEYAKNEDLLLISHSEDMSLTNGGSCNEGENATRAGLKAISRASEEMGIARELVLAANFGARVHIAHVSTRGAVEMIRVAKAHGVRVTAETCPHYFAADDSLILDYNTNAKINPPLRTPDDVAAVVEGLKDGTLDVIATDHAPHHLDDKDVPFEDAAFGSTGLETAFGVGYTYLVKTGHLTLARLAQLMSTAPAGVLGLQTGKIEIGAAADLCLAELDTPYVVDAAHGASKSHNCVFDGRELYGKIVTTIVNGEVRYEE